MVFVLALPAFSRQGSAPLSYRRAVRPLNAVRQLVVGPTDAGAELAADALQGGGPPLRFAASTVVEVTTATHGTWEQLAEGRLWHLRIISAGATDLNFGFSTFRLPEGATLHICAEGEAYFQGPYTARDNKPHRQLWTPVIPGASAYLELFIPAGSEDEGELVLTRVNRGYRDMFHRGKALIAEAAGACEIDVVCPQAADWRREIRSVARYSVGGTALCTGTLVTDADGDFKNYFLTANHCGITTANAATMVVYWNYQSPTCGQLGGGSLAQNQNGAIFRAAKADVDFTLVELEDSPDSSFNVYYAGWDRTGLAPVGAVGIHHPNAAEKAISFSTTPLSTVSSCIGTSGSATHWNVVWSVGVTEEGSSGSAIWDPATHGVVGTLSGGGSSCSTPHSPDCYGKLAMAWASGASAATRLQDWLDPQGIGVTSMPGLDPNQRVMVTAVGSRLLSENCSPPNQAIDPGERVTVQFTLRNDGGLAASNVVATLQPTGGVTDPSPPVAYGTLSENGAVVSRSFSFTASGPCGSRLAPILSLQAGTDDLGTVSFDLPVGSPQISFAQNFDGVTPPSLPGDWSSTVSGAGSAWSISTAQADSAPNAAFAPDVGGVSDSRLFSPPMAITTAAAQLSFRHQYNLEVGTGGTGFDGGVLEISVDGGAFGDIINASATFVTNGYNALLSTRYRNPLAGRIAWSGASPGFVTSVVLLPGSLAGHSVQFSWRLGCDRNNGAVGWSVDGVTLTDGFACCQGLVQPLLVNTRRLGASMAFSYSSVAGQSYVVESKSGFAAATWLPLQTNAGDGSLQSFTNALTGSQRVFRLRTQ